MINHIIYKLIKRANAAQRGPFGYPYLPPSNEPINPELRQRLIDQRHFIEYMDKLLDGKVIKTNPYNITNTPLNAKAKAFFNSFAKKFPKL